MATLHTAGSHSGDYPDHAVQTPQSAGDAYGYHLSYADMTRAPDNGADDMPPCRCGHPNGRHGLGHPCNVPGCDCPYYRAVDPCR